MESVSQDRLAIGGPSSNSLRFFSSYRITHLGILAIFPLLLAFLNDYWAFTTSQSPMIDPWLYTSYFLHLKSQLLAFPGAYYGDRLSYTVPGWLLYHVFGPMAGNYILKLSVIYIAIFALYYATATLFHERTALLCGVLISIQPYFLMAFGWDYVDGIGIAYYSLSLLCVLRAAQSGRWRLWLFAGGVFFTSLISTQLLWLNIAWTVPALYYAANRLLSKHRFWESVALFVSGAGLAFAACCAIYFLLTGNWFYIANSVRHTLHGFGAAQKIADPVIAWIGYAQWLVPYNALMLVALWRLFRRGESSLGRMCLVLFVTCYGTIWIWEVVGFPFTKLLYYSDYIFPAYVLALAALLHNWVEKLRPLVYVLIVGSVLVIGGGLFFSIPALDRLLQSLPVLLQQHPALAPVWHYQALWASAVGAAACLCLCARRFSTTLMAVFLAGILLMGGIQLTFHSRQGWFSHSPGSDYTNKQGFQLILDADAWADRIRPDRRVLVWYNQTEPRMGIIGGLSSLYLWGWSLLNVNLPDLVPKDAERIQPYGDILVMSWDTNAILKAQRSLESVGWEVSRERETTIRNGKLALHLGFLDVTSTKSENAAMISKEGLEEIPGVLKLSEVLPTTPETLLRSDEALDITTPAQLWAYAAYTPLPFLDTDRDKVWIRISAKVLSGQAGFGILNSSEKAFYTRTTVAPTTGYQDVTLEIDHPGDSSKLIIEDDTPSGQKAEVKISHIDILALPNSKIWKRLMQKRQAPQASRANSN